MPEPPIRLNPEPPPDRLTSIVMPPDPAVKLAVPSFVVAPVATKSAAKLALTVAPVLTTRISSVTKSVMVSVPRSTLKVSAPAPPVSAPTAAIAQTGQRSAVTGPPMGCARPSV